MVLPELETSLCSFVLEAQNNTFYLYKQINLNTDLYFELKVAE